MADERKATPLEVLARKAQVVKNVLQTEDGKELFEILRREFFNTQPGKTETETIFNAGSAAVIAYLMQLDRFNFEGR